MTMVAGKAYFRGGLVLLALTISTSVASGQLVATGVINGSLDHQGGIVLMFNSDPAGVPLSGAGSANATLAFGNVSVLGPLTAGVTRVRTANSFTISSPFIVNVDSGGTASASFNLSAFLSAVPGAFTYQMAGRTLTTTSQVISANDARYAQNVQYTLAITIPTAVAPQTISNTVNFMATAN